MVKSRLDYIEWDATSQAASDALKDGLKAVETALDRLLQPSRERSLAMTALEECFMWVGKAIRHDQLNHRDGTLPLPVDPAEVTAVYYKGDAKDIPILVAGGITSMAPAPEQKILLPAGWEVIGLPRRIGGIMAVEVRTKT